MNNTKAEILKFIGEGLKVDEVAKKVGVNRSYAFKVVDEFIRAGVVQRTSGYKVIRDEKVKSAYSG